MRQRRPEPGNERAERSCLEEYFQHSTLGGAGKRRIAARQRKSAINHFVGVNFLSRQQLQGRFKPPATRANQRDFVDDGGSHVDLYGIVNCRLANDRAARPRHSNGLLESSGRSGCVNNDVVSRRGEPSCDFAGDAGAFRNPEFLPMPTELMNLCAVRREGLRDQESEFPVTQNCHSRALWNLDLIQNFARGGDRLRKDGALIPHGARDLAEILFGQREELGEGAGMLDDPEDTSMGAVTLQTSTTPVAFLTSEIDFSDDALPDPFGGVRLYDIGDEFVSRASAKPVIAALQLQVGVADSRQSQAQQCITLGPFRLGRFPNFNIPALEMNRDHVESE